MALTGTPDTAVDSNECANAQDQPEVLMGLDGRRGAGARVVIAVSIDGGSITEFERHEIPSICKGAISSIRRRGYSWGDNIHVLWCRFPTVQSFLESCSGVPNLVRTMEEEASFAVDHMELSTSFVVSASSHPIDGEQAKFRESVLRTPVMELMAETRAINPQSFVHAVSSDDLETVEFLISRGADPNMEVYL